MAEAAGVSVETLRYYERRGILDDPVRTLGGHRLYPTKTVTVLKVIKAAQRLGFTLREVADLLQAGEHRHGRRPTAGLRHSLEAKLTEVEARLADLVVIRDTLREARDAGCDDVAACAASSCCPLPFAELATVPARPA